MAETTFGRLAFNNSAFVRRLKARKTDISEDQYLYAIQWMQFYHPTHDPRLHVVKYWTDEELRNARKLRNDGWSYKKISEFLNRNPGEIHRKLNK